MQVKNGKVMFCHCCSNGNLDGGCIYGWEETCGTTQMRLDEILNPEFVSELKEGGELPYNFKGFKIAGK